MRILASLLLAVSVCLSGCASYRAPAVDATHETQKQESSDAKVRRLEGELKVAKLERDDARLAGPRALLNWATGILALCAVAGLVAAVFMKSRLLGYGALACAAGAVAAQVTNRALDHIELISWCALIALAVGAGVMVWRYHKD